MLVKASIIDIVSADIFKNFKQCLSRPLHSLPSDQIVLKAMEDIEDILRAKINNKSKNKNKQ